MMQAIIFNMKGICVILEVSLDIKDIKDIQTQAYVFRIKPHSDI